MARFDELGKAIGIAISKDESGVRNLLKRNGVNTSSIKTKSQLSDVFIESLVKIASVEIMQTILVYKVVKVSILVQEIGAVISTQKHLLEI